MEPPGWPPFNLDEPDQVWIYTPHVGWEKKCPPQTQDDGKLVKKCSAYSSNGKYGLFMWELIEGEYTGTSTDKHIGYLASSAFFHPMDPLELLALL